MRCIITGAARGIGRAIARRVAADCLAREHAPAALLLSDQHAGELEALAGELRSQGHRVDVLAGDMSEVSLPAALVERALASFGELDAIVSNAGYAVGKPLMELAVEDWDKNFAVHARAAWLLARAAHAPLKESHGCLLLTTSISGTNATPSLGAYSASKAATIMLARQLALDWGPDGIRVNTLSPGLTLTEGNPMNAETIALREERIPLRRVASPEDIAGAASFLLGADAGYVTGVDLVVDGGLVNTLMQTVGMQQKWNSR